MLGQNLLKRGNTCCYLALVRARKFSATSLARGPESPCVPVLRIPKANVYRFGDGNSALPVFKDLEWTINDGESWAIVGPAGSEKSQLLDMLRGYMRITPPPYGGLYPFLYLANPPRDPHDSIAQVSFTARKRAAGGAFVDFTARYGAVRDEDRVTLREALFSEFTSTGGKEESEELQELNKLAERLDLTRLLDLPFVVLSNGQTRRARIAKALLAKPELLLLDEPLTGLDVLHRPKLFDLLHEIHSSKRPRVIMALRPQDPLPDWITHVALVNGQFVETRSRDSSFTPILGKLSNKIPDSIPRAEEGKELVVMKDVNVRYHERHVLKNINWTIREGERWHLQGANGSGKTTLLSVLTGDHPQSYTQPHLILFDLPRRRQPTSSLQRLIGSASPEIFNAFPRRLGPGALTVRDTIATGFESTFSYRKRTAEMDAQINDLLDQLGPKAWAVEASLNTNEFDRRPFAMLAPGEQSMVLLMRALVSQAPLLILDEVFSGMDSRMIAAARRYLRDELSPKQAAVFITHWEDEVPWDNTITKKIKLDNGIAHLS